MCAQLALSRLLHHSSWLPYTTPSGGLTHSWLQPSSLHARPTSPSLIPPPAILRFLASELRSAQACRGKLKSEQHIGEFGLVVKLLYPQSHVASLQVWASEIKGHDAGERSEQNV
jgi:hypothetical protein